MPKVFIPIVQSEIVSSQGWKLRDQGVPDGYSMFLILGMMTCFIGFLWWAKRNNISEDTASMIFSFAVILVFGLVMVLHKHFKGRWTNIWHRETELSPQEVIKRIQRALDSGNLAHSSGLGPEEANLYVPVSCIWGFALPTNPVLVVKVRRAISGGRSKIYIGKQTDENQIQIEGIRKIIDSSIGLE